MALLPTLSKSGDQAQTSQAGDLSLAAALIALGSSVGGERGTNEIATFIDGEAGVLLYR